ncbi:hypothetical protein [Flavobacterium cerinum]|uniref:Uncharacterized protein n=1 Tax=Flavobacterium cerinum TaxID=2502784 RepID=A0ABY5ISQ9_9FLAO|nr:hypothetical protein [Flavobacterium cerinum]UUC44567.1 hypothetical protein NOX80_13105 [Flavobacterium cerinum]
MKTVLWLVTVFFSITIQAQNIQQIDSLNVVLCQSLKDLGTIDEQGIDKVLEKHLPDFFERHKIDTKEKSDSIHMLIYFRLQKECHPFVAYLATLDENKSDWKILNEKPKNNSTKAELKKFFSTTDFYYKEYEGNSITVKINSNQYSEKFEDGSFSKLEFIKTSDSTFSLKFIESDNRKRKNLSVKGEIYHYGIYGKGDTYYDVWTTTDNKQYYAFRFYIGKP